MSPGSTGGRYGMTFVLIPGAGGEAWYWHRLVAELDRRGHDAVAVELPAGDDGAGWAEYAAAVVAAAGGPGGGVVRGAGRGRPSTPPRWSPRRAAWTTSCSSRSRWGASPHLWCATGCRCGSSCCST